MTGPKIAAVVDLLVTAGKQHDQRVLEDLEARRRPGSSPAAGP